MKTIAAVVGALLLGLIVALSTTDKLLQDAQVTLKSWYADLVVKDNPQPIKLMKDEKQANKKESRYELW